MKSQSFKELDLVIEGASSFVGFGVEDAILSAGYLLLLLRFREERVFFVIDAESQKPVFVWTHENLPSLKKQVKPLALFLKKHLLGLSLVRCFRRLRYGRCVVLEFADAESSFEMELHLFPQSRNIIARKGKVQVSLHKIDELREVGEGQEDASPRSAEQIYREWLEFFKAKPVKKAAGGGGVEQVLAKKRKGLEDLRRKLTELEADPWRGLGDWLSVHRDLEAVPADCKSLLDKKMNLQENIERAFEKSKASKVKRASVEERLQLLERELAEIEKNPSKLAKPVAAAPSPLEGAKGRTRVFDGGITAYVGRSAQDNIQILRRCRPWHLWVHIKDLPGSHGFIAFNKLVEVPSSVLHETALWVIKESLTPKQWVDWQGIKCEVIVCECRFVSPLKGDRVGRVTYKNEKVLTLVVQDGRGD